MNYSKNQLSALSHPRCLVKFRVVTSLSLMLFILIGGVVTKAQLRCAVETDPLPFVLGGWIGAVSLGTEHVHVRVLDAYVHKPTFLLPDGFDENFIHSNAALLDYLPGGSAHQAWCFSVGAVRWSGEIREIKSSKHKSYTSGLVSFDVGYYWFLDSHFYLSPWCALHLRCLGDSELDFGTSSYTIPLLNPEASIKLGYCFTL